MTLKITEELLYLYTLVHNINRKEILIHLIPISKIEKLAIVLKESCEKLEGNKICSKISHILTLKILLKGVFTLEYYFTAYF